jgi:four helix bundle protein
MHRNRASARLLAWQLSDQLRSSIRKLTRGEALDRDYKLRSQLDDAAGEVVHNVEKALATDHEGEFARFVRIARTAVSDLQTGLRIALMKKRVSQRDLGEAHELCSRLYPALASLLVQSSSHHQARPTASM